LWSVESLQPVGELAGAANQLLSVAFSPDRTLIAAGERAAPTSTVHLWDAQSNQYVASLTGIKGFLTDIAFSPDGSLLAVGAGQATIHIFDMATKQEVYAVALPDARKDQLADNVQFSADGTMLIWTVAPNLINIWGVPN
jgi:WD40 repeat protein